MNRLYTSDEVAEKLRCHRSTVTTTANRLGLTTTKVGRAFVYNDDDVTKISEELRSAESASEATQGGDYSSLPPGKVRSIVLIRVVLNTLTKTVPNPPSFDAVQTMVRRTEKQLGIRGARVPRASGGGRHDVLFTPPDAKRIHDTLLKKYGAARKIAPGTTSSSSIPQSEVFDALAKRVADEVTRQVWSQLGPTEQMVRNLTTTVTRIRMQVMQLHEEWFASSLKPAKEPEQANGVGHDPVTPITMDSDGT